MSQVFGRHTKANLPVAVRGDGIYIFDSNGKSYLDGSGGAAVSCLGHSDVDVIQAIKSQLDSLDFAHTGFLTSEPAESLASKLIAHAPTGLERVYLVSGGSEAVEAALKLSRQYMLEIGQPERTRFIARRQSYHGNTLGALGTGGNLWRREPFDPVMVSASHIAPCYEYRDRADGESVEDYGQRVANELEEELLRVGPETVIGFLAEPVVGATSGAVPAVKGYFRRIREICDKYGVLLILDEVMCGMGRTGTLFACEQDDVRPDIVTIAKGLGAGYQPIGAMICSGEIYRAIENGTGFFQHGHTYMGHPIACAAANAVVTKLTDGGYSNQAATMGNYLNDALQAEFGQHPNVGDIRGRGMFRGLEFVADRDSKSPFDPNLKIASRLKAAAMDNGLICYPMNGTIDGVRGDHVLLAPPFICTNAQIDELVDKLSASLASIL
ncbi:aspartate aminotransferase family protein [Octadecabacter ascidiaceicola]|uniref:Adenosylmethionine-8-amino-7-oxononanoate aminotransferase n=1 Tax=Octadecabacter ascidiaceicola TaxID=1655543 RepID=A0A238KIB8_9RHOB|nr:aspartate aminotransferase family protein [Octadecabacter ascidiaceicola]SMX42450.1 Adenosylmethionine-8-amino-7-oxononanoate aminotransferase [Octadecabacter ascidiaceicola]